MKTRTYRRAVIGCALAAVLVALAQVLPPTREVLAYAVASIGTLVMIAMAFAPLAAASEPEVHMPVCRICGKVREDNDDPGSATCAECRRRAATAGYQPITEQDTVPQPPRGGTGQA